MLTIQLQIIRFISIFKGQNESTIEYLAPSVELVLLLNLRTRAWNSNMNKFQEVFNLQDSLEDKKGISEFTKFTKKGKLNRNVPL